MEIGRVRCGSATIKSTSINGIRFRKLPLRAKKLYTIQYAFREGSASRSQQDANPQYSVSVTPTTGQPIIITQTVSWTTLFTVVCLTVSSLAGGFIASVLYLRPVLKATEEATKNADIAAKEMEKAAKEMEKTALLFQQEMPVTFQDVRKTSEEFELLGKQLNYLFGVVVRPVEPVGKAAQWVEKAAGTTTSSLSKRLADDTASLANSLRSSVNQFRKQFGWGELTAAEAEEAKRLVDIGRAQQEARTWIAQWRSKNGATPSFTPQGIASYQKQQDERDVETMAQLGGLLRESMIAKSLALGGEASLENDMAVAQVFAALDRAQRAAEEAAVSSSVLEEAIQEAERTGLLPALDMEPGTHEDDDDYELETY